MKFSMTGQDLAQKEQKVTTVPPLKQSKESGIQG
jgi:hypothetical protein